MISVLMLLDNMYTNDRRVQREAEALVEAGYDVYLAAVSGKDLPKEENINGVKVYRIMEHSRLFDVKDLKYAKELASTIVSKFEFDILHTHDREMLHIATYIHKIKTGFQYIHDIHEMHFSYPVYSDTDDWIIRLKASGVHFIKTIREKRDSKIIKNFITVNESLEVNLRAHFGLPFQGYVLRNIPETLTLGPKSNILREKFDIPADTKILVFIGGNIYPKSLNLEQVMDEVGNMQKIALVFICADNVNKRNVEKYSIEKKYTNVYYHPLISANDIPSFLSSADVGLVPTWNKKNLSYWYALDNKLFEYLMSEIPILATAQPEYINIVEKNNIGICVNPDEKNAYRDGLVKILNELDSYTDKLKFTKSILNWQKEKNILLDLYSKIKSEISVNGN